MPDSTIETPKTNEVPDIYYLTKAGISAEKAQEILDKKKLAAENVEQARTAGGDLYERVALGHSVTSIQFGGGELQLAMESPTTGNLTEKIRAGLAGLNPAPPEDEEIALYEGIASKALKEKDYPAAINTLRIAYDDPNLEKPDILKKLQDSTQGDVEQQLKLAQVLSELLPKKDSVANTAPESAVAFGSDLIPTETKIPPIEFPKVEPTIPNHPSIVETPTPTATPTETPTRTFTPTATPTEIPSETTTTVTPATIANEPQIPEPAPDLSGYDIPSTKSNVTTIPGLTPLAQTIDAPTPLNLAGTRPLNENKTDLSNSLSTANTNSQPTLVEVSTAQTPPGLRPVPDQQITNPTNNIDNISDIRPPISASGFLNKFNPLTKKAA